MCGLPGSGKTTHSRGLVRNHIDARRFCIDDEFRALSGVRNLQHRHNKAAKNMLAKARAALVMGAPVVVVDSCALSEARRARIASIALPSTQVEIHAALTDERTCRSRRLHIRPAQWEKLRTLWEPPRGPNIVNVSA